MKKNIIVLSGAGSLIPCYCGLITKLHSNNQLEKLNTYMGTSAGSIIAMLLALNLTPDTITNIIMNFDFNKLVNKNNFIVNILRTIKYYGYNSNVPLKNAIKKILKQQGISPNIKFKDLPENKDLNITVRNLTKGKTEVWNKESNPEMSIVDAVVTSCSIPFFFTPDKYDGEFYCDGGLTSNYSINWFKDKPYDFIFGFIPYNKKKDFIDHEINSLYSYGKAVVLNLYNEPNYGHIEDEFWVCTTKIDTKSHSSIDFNLSLKDKWDLFNCGYNSI